MSDTESVRAQLADELNAALAGPASDLLGLDLASHVRERVADRAPMLAGQLCQDADDRLAAQTVIDVLGCLWPHGVTDHGWWTTPLGRACARSLGADDAEAVTQSVAAAMLGVTRGTVSQLVHRGSLDRHPDGGVSRSAVLARLGRLG